MLGSRTDLHIFDAGSVNGTRYCNEILLPYVRLFRDAMGLQFLFMDDNAPCHRTVAAEQLLESEDIERMDWPARSPDLNPIEHVWDFLGRRLAARTLPPVTIRELRLTLQDEWAAMPQQLIDTLILSMGRRCETCLAVRGRSYPLQKTEMFLAGHPSQGCFGLQSHCAPCYFFNKASFYLSDFSFSKCCLHITHVLTYWDLTVLNVLIWKAFVQSYIEKAVLSLIFAHQCIYKGEKRLTHSLTDSLTNHDISGSIKPTDLKFGRGKRGEVLGRIDRQNSRFRTAKTTIIKFGLQASFVELESDKSALNELNRVPLRMDITEINSRGKRGEVLGRIDRQNSRFRTAKTTIIKFGLQASFVELESAKSALNELPAFDQVSEFDRGRIVAYRDCGLSFREIGSRVGRNQTIVMRICDRWMQEGTTDRRGRSHPPQCTPSLSASTVRRRLQQSGLSARRPLLGLPLTQNHRRIRHQSCDERRTWAAEWNEVVFSDESRICLQHHDVRIRVCRHRGERMLNSCVMHRHTGPAPGIMGLAGSLSGYFTDRKQLVHGCSTIDPDYTTICHTRLTLATWGSCLVCCTPRTHPKSL
ncbi:transposable element Tcb1 transposase [Trichonephila clavipes]|nr:transposable element Tcb1 transposase [Trichonephila clavipes]